MDELRNIYADKRVGELLEFGRWPQGANGEVKPVVWRVLRRQADSVPGKKRFCPECGALNLEEAPFCAKCGAALSGGASAARVLRREADHLLVIAEQGLDFKPYGEEKGEAAWAGCSLRRWLNNEFCGKAFDERERALILPSGNAGNAGPDTQDRVFLLSLDEAVSLFADDKARRAVPAEFAAKNNAYSSDDGFCCWWLRSLGGIYVIGGMAALVDAAGVVGFTRADCGINAVRPAMRLVL